MGIIFSRLTVRVPEVTHGPGRPAPASFYAVAACRWLWRRPVMPGKLLWGDIMELEAPLEESENQKKERQKVRWRRAAPPFGLRRLGQGGEPSLRMACQDPARASEGFLPRRPRPYEVAPRPFPPPHSQPEIRFWVLARLPVALRSYPLAPESPRRWADKLPSPQNLFFLVLSSFSSEACYLVVLGLLRRWLRKVIALNVCYSLSPCPVCRNLEAGDLRLTDLSN
jgi:hypothetical protein